ncbi:phage major capsid protein [Phyllobacterium salinisoli]|uniref:Phage major capsid protein n=2 Tax=Phyllobacterium salinisoli TaxID=1899321 RepID=A0A368KBQ3_9HYPH|nr:phage major capsid protein [Phyllobacterium salinisoli]
MGDRADSEGGQAAGVGLDRIGAVAVLAQGRGQITFLEDTDPGIGGGGLQLDVLVAVACTRQPDLANDHLGQIAGCDGLLWQRAATEGLVDHDAGQVLGGLRLALAEDFGQKEGAAFLNGDGVLQPMGVMNDQNVLNTVNGHATNVSADKLIDLLYALPAQYRNAGSWAMNGTTLAAVRKLKDGQGNYLWQPSYQAGEPETILGRPVVEMIDMPDIGNGNFPIIYGDWSGYRIVDRVGLSILVNPYLLATDGITRIHATRRVGGGVLQAAKFRKLKMTAS